MKKKLILLKAILTRDMSLYNNSTLAKKKDISYKTIPLIMSVMIFFSMAIFALVLGYYLKRVDKTYCMLSMFLAIFSISLYMEGIYKSQDILFVAKDNDLLLSLPITYKTLLLIRVIKLIIFQFIFNLLFITPVFFIYSFLEQPSMSFYITSLLFMFLMPIIPTIFSSINGYIIKWLTTKFTAKKITQLIFSFIFTFIFFLLVSKIKFGNIISNANGINDSICKYYYPIKAYQSLINHFDIITLIKLLLFNIIPLIIFVYIGSIYYFKILSKSNETGRVVKNTKLKKIKKLSQTKSLIKKELMNYVSTPMYSYNTLIGLATMLIATIYICINKNSILNASISIMRKEDIIYYLPKLYCIVIIFVSSTLTISASSLSLEGKSFNLIKSLPIDVRKFINSKLLASTIISSSFLLASSIIFILSFRVFTVDALVIILYSIIVPLFISIIGLLLNFRYPKLEYANVSEVVKQSLSVLAAELLGVIIFIVSIITLFWYVLDIYKGVIIELCIFVGLSIIFYIILYLYGINKYKEMCL